MTQFNEGKRYEGIRTIKITEFENTTSDVKIQQATSKIFAITEKKEKSDKYVRKTKYTNHEHLPPA